MYNFSISVFFKRPVVILRILFRAMSNFIARAEWYHILLAYSPAENIEIVQ